MNIVVTGGAGYLGSVLVPKLLVRGHRVRVLDVGYFGLGHLRSMRPGVEVVREDVRRFCEDPRECSRILNGMHCVIHLAAISNDPSAELDPALTAQVNFQATRALAEAAKAQGVRFIFSSSCSVYGEAVEQVDEEGELRPCTAYAHSKVRLRKSCGRPRQLSPRVNIMQSVFSFSDAANHVEVRARCSQPRR